jgi:hypothetical protein
MDSDYACKIDIESGSEYMQMSVLLYVHIFFDAFCFTQKALALVALVRPSSVMLARDSHYQ